MHPKKMTDDKPKTIEITNPWETVKNAVVSYALTGLIRIPAWVAVNPGKSIDVEEDTITRNLRLGFVNAGPSAEELEKKIATKEKEIVEAKKLKAKKLAEAKKKADEEAKKLAESNKNKKQ